LPHAEFGIYDCLAQAQSPNVPKKGGDIQPVAALPIGNIAKQLGPGFLIW
jgi:hypothetical protein